MTRNPFINALSATTYIFLVVTVMTMLMAKAPKEDSFLAPILFLSMFTLSAAVMGYLFGYKPLDLFLSGKKKDAIKLFLQTVGIFAIFTIIIFGLVIV